jgi:hypothetical protein
MEKKIGFTCSDMAIIQDYYDKSGDSVIPLSVLPNVYNLFMNGSSLIEINEIYNEYPYNKLLYTAWKYNWIEQRESRYSSLNEKLEQEIDISIVNNFSMIKNLLNVAYKEHMPQITAYIKNPCVRNLPTLRIKNLIELKEYSKLMREIIKDIKTIPLQVDEQKNENVLLDVPKPIETAVDYLNKLKEKSKV